MDQEPSGLLQLLQAEVDKNLTNDQFGVDQLCANLGMSRSSLHRRLKESTGQSVGQFIREYRLIKGQELLLSSELSVSEVAFKIGFGSSTYFNYCYRNYFGYTPGETKKRNRQAHIERASKKPKARSIKKWPLVVLAVSVLMVTTALYQLTQEDSPNRYEAGQISVAVLPFQNQSTDPDNQYFADGVMEAILNKLSIVSGLRVVPRTSVEKFRNSNATIAEIAEELEVAYVLEGSTQKYDNEIKLTARLIEVRQEGHLWAKEYIRSFSDIFLLQEEIADNVATALKITLSAEENRAISQHPTDNTEAYQYYMMGNYLTQNVTLNSLHKAVDYYSKALDLDSLFVDAKVKIAWLYSVGGGIYGLFSREEVLKAKPLLVEALEIDPNHLMAHDVLASYYFYHEWSFDSAVLHYKKVKEISNHYNYLAADFFIKHNDLATAREIVDYQLAQDSLNLFLTWSFLSETQFFGGETRAALRTLDHTWSLFGERTSMAELSKLYYHGGDFQKAENCLKRVDENYSASPIPLEIWLRAALTYHREEDPGPFLQQLEAMFENKASGSPAWFLSVYYAESGDLDRAFFWLQQSYAAREVEITWLLMEPAWQAYKEDSRYVQMLEKVGFKRVARPG